MNESTKPGIGAAAPDFNLRDGDGNQWRPQISLAKWWFCFLSGDETPVCTRQMCSLRDRWQDYEAHRREVVGLSTDSVESHKHFADHHDLPLRRLPISIEKLPMLMARSPSFPGKWRVQFSSSIEKV
jgi:peroxiredoxin Q/BCP